MRAVVSDGLPAAFPVAAGGGRRPEGLVTVEAAITGGHQKEALVYPAAPGPVWRLASDEGAYLRGTDLAPAPLMYWAAGVHADFARRLAALARTANADLRRLALAIEHGYQVSGSFAQGGARGEAFAPTLELEVECNAPPAAMRSLVDEAAAGSPLFAAMRTPRSNTFALYVNGRRRTLSGIPASNALDIADPFLAHAAAPQPARRPAPAVIGKQPLEPDAKIFSMPTSTGGLKFSSRIEGEFDLATGLDHAAVIFPGIPASTFSFVADATGERAPTGLAYAWAGVAFCYLTQVSRYVETRKLAVTGVRLVQRGPEAGPVDTHLFLNGGADDATMAELLGLAARTCYLHATLGASLAPQVRLTTG
jgi:hypothetical protein